MGVEYDTTEEDRIKKLKRESLRKQDGAAFTALAVGYNMSRGWLDGLSFGLFSRLSAGANPLVEKYHFDDDLSYGLSRAAGEYAQGVFLSNAAAANHANKVLNAATKTAYFADIASNGYNAGSGLNSIREDGLNPANAMQTLGGISGLLGNATPRSTPRVKSCRNNASHSLDDAVGASAPRNPVSYKRPSGYRKGVRDQSWENAKGPDGLVRDPKTNSIMNNNDAWDMGHKPGYEFRKHAASAEQRGINRQQFLDEHNYPSHYRPELSSSNRSHSGELPDDVYYGP